MILLECNKRTFEETEETKIFERNTSTKNLDESIVDVRQIDNRILDNKGKYKHVLLDLDVEIKNFTKEKERLRKSGEMKAKLKQAYEDYKLLEIQLRERNVELRGEIAGQNYVSSKMCALIDGGMGRDNAITARKSVADDKLKGVRADCFFGSAISNSNRFGTC